MHKDDDKISTVLRAYRFMQKLFLDLFFIFFKYEIRTLSGPEYILSPSVKKWMGYIRPRDAHDKYRKLFKT